MGDEAENSLKASKSEESRSGCIGVQESSGLRDKPRAVAPSGGVLNGRCSVSLGGLRGGPLPVEVWH